MKISFLKIQVVFLRKTSKIKFVSSIQNCLTKNLKMDFKYKNNTNSRNSILHNLSKQHSGSK